MTHGPPQGAAAGGEGPDAFCVRIPNLMAAVGQANRSVEEFLESRRVPGDVVFNVTLALEEVVTNVIKYSFEAPGPHEIEIEARWTPERITLRVVDDGREFDPCLAAPPDFEKPCEERPVGGLGVHLLRKLAETMEYRRAGGQNVLTLTFITRPES